jgi:hypothetical protein
MDRLTGTALAFMVLVEFTAGAQAAATCTQQKAYCKSVNTADNQGAAGQARCEDYFAACMQTGVWTSRQRTIAGMIKK